MQIKIFPTGLIVASALVSACSFVDMAPGADEVRVVAETADIGACEKRGEIEVSVKDRVGPYERDALRVRDELEILARNEADSLAADTIQPKGAEQAGVQRFVAYRCGRAMTTPKASRQTVKDAAETAPLQD